MVPTRAVADSPLAACMSTTFEDLEQSADRGAAGADPFDAFLAGKSTVVGSPRHWFNMYFPAREFSEDLDILVTSCASAQAAQLAVTNPRGRIVAIDTDADALEQAEARKRKHALSNLEIVEQTVEDVSGLERNFDLIFSSGELCYLTDPSRGLRALRDALLPSGVMNLKLIGSYGRQGIQLVRLMLGILGVHSGEPQERTRKVLEALATADPFGSGGSQLKSWAGDRSAIEALLQKNEQTYDIPGLYRLVESSGLRVQRPLCQAYYQPQCTQLAASGELFTQVMGLPEDNQQAITELYRGGMQAHEFIVCRDDRPASEYDISFDGQGWLDYVPVANPGLSIIQEDLPPGTAARLRWDSHYYPEISALVDARQASLFNAGDGFRTISEVIAEAGGGLQDGTDREFARNFFQSMWRLDYLWFRTVSRRAALPEGPLPVAPI